MSEFGKPTYAHGFIAGVDAVFSAMVEMERPMIGVCSMSLLTCTPRDGRAHVILALDPRNTAQFLQVLDVLDESPTLHEAEDRKWFRIAHPRGEYHISATPERLRALNAAA